MLIHDTSDEGLVSVEQTECLECCPHLWICMWDKVVVGKGRKGGGTKGFESTGEGGWKDREEVSLEGERICIPNSTAQSE